MSNHRLFTTNLKLNSTIPPTTGGIILNSSINDISQPNETLLSGTKLNDQGKTSIGRINKVNSSATGFTALILLILGILIFLFICFIIGRCMGEEEEDRRSRKRPRKSKFSIALKKKNPTSSNNEILHQKRVYEIQAEEGCYSAPPSIYEISDDKLIVPSPAPIIEEKSPSNDDFPTPEIIISGTDVAVKNIDTIEKPKNKALEAIMKRKATTSDTPPALLNVLKKKAMLNKTEI
uniref:Uncharacterized protein n=1 Tax=Strongyloides stercoralis TaxID=6248 RepID=A0A0K0EBT4_STRER